MDTKTENSIKVNDSEFIKNQMSPFFASGQVIELRAIGFMQGNNKQTASGYFDNIDSFAQAVVSINGKYEGIYFTPNEINPVLLSRSVNQIKIRPKNTTQDIDIIRIKWLLIDIDPVRPSGISSNDEEHEYSLNKAREIKEWLESQGWSGKYILADSGNGGHLLWAIDMLNDSDSKKLREKILKFLDSKFSDEKAKVDITVFNPSRIWKVYGSKACKGDHTLERPHRRAQIIENGGTGFITTEEVLAVAELLPEPETAKTIHPRKTEDNGNRNTFELQKFFDKNGIDILKTKDFPYGRGYIVPCPWNSDHKDAMVIQFHSGALKFSCFHNSCSDKDWREYRLFYDPEAYSGGLSSLNENSELERFLKISKQGKITVDCPGIAEKFAEKFAEKYHCFTSAESLYLYQDGVFSNKSDFLTSEIQAFLRKHTTNKIISEIHSYILRKKVLEPDDLNPEAKRLINVENGMLDWRKKELLPHNPKYLSTVRIPIEFNPEADSPNIKQFLDSLFSDNPENIDLLLEMVGYFLIPCNLFHKWFILEGNGANGKSTLLNLIIAFIGERNISHIPVQYLCGEDKFALSNLKDKLLNIGDDLDSYALKRTGELKTIVSGGRLSAQEKGKRMFEFIPFARLVFACNNLPDTMDKSKAFWHRLIVIKFSQVFEGANQKKGLIEALTMPEELSGLLNIALASLHRLMEKERFSENYETRKALREYRSEVDSVQSFIENQCALDSSYKVVKSQLFEAYWDYCRNDLEVTPMSRNKFYKHLENGWDIKTVSSTAQRIGGQQTFEGIGLLCNNEHIRL